MPCICEYGLATSTGVPKFRKSQVPGAGRGEHVGLACFPRPGPTICIERGWSQAASDIALPMLHAERSAQQLAAPAE